VDALNKLLPGQALSASGRPRLDYAAVAELAFPFMLNSVVPLAHILSFKPGAGCVDWLPQARLGAVGGWFAALAYICCLGTMLFLRWRSAAWRRVVLR
jgi:Na+-driven multidrug efflux pump